MSIDFFIAIGLVAAFFGAILALAWWTAGIVVRARRSGLAFAIGFVCWWIGTTIVGAAIWTLMVVVRRRRAGPFATCPTCGHRVPAPKEVRP